jgi:hypothetical protein
MSEVSFILRIFGTVIAVSVFVCLFLGMIYSFRLSRFLKGSRSIFVPFFLSPFFVDSEDLDEPARNHQRRAKQFYAQGVSFLIVAAILVFSTYE